MKTRKALSLFAAAAMAFSLAACGAPQILVSDTPCMREVYGPCAAYIDLTTNPGDVDAVTPATAPTAVLLEKYSWDKSAERLLQILKK